MSKQLNMNAADADCNEASLGFVGWAPPNGPGVWLLRLSGPATAEAPSERIHRHSQAHLDSELNVGHDLLKVVLGAVAMGAIRELRSPAWGFFWPVLGSEPLAALRKRSRFFVVPFSCSDRHLGWAGEPFT